MTRPPASALTAGEVSEAAVTGLENEIPYPVSRVVTDIEAALRRKSFHDRIAEKLAADPDWKQDPD